MSDALLIAIIVAVPSTLSAFASVLSAINSRKGLLVSRGNAAGIADVQKNTNGLLASSKASARAEGVEEGHASGVASGAIAGAKQERDRASEEDDKRS